MRSTHTFKRAQKYEVNGSSNILHHSKTRQYRRQFSNEQDSGPPNFCNAISQFNIDVPKTSQGLLTHEWRRSDRTPGWWSSRRATSSLNLELEEILESRYQNVYFFTHQTMEVWVSSEDVRTPHETWRTCQACTQDWGPRGHRALAYGECLWG